VSSNVRRDGTLVFLKPTANVAFKTFKRARFERGRIARPENTETIFGRASDHLRVLEPIVIGRRTKYGRTTGAAYHSRRRRNTLVKVDGNTTTRARVRDGLNTCLARRSVDNATLQPNRVYVSIKRTGRYADNKKHSGHIFA